MKRKIGKTGRHDCEAFPDKVRYRDRRSAKTAMTIIQGSSTRDSVPVRVYRCPACDGFHLTSQQEG